MERSEKWKYQTNLKNRDKRKRSDRWKDLKNGNIRQIERTETKEKIRQMERSDKLKYKTKEKI